MQEEVLRVHCVVKVESATCPRSCNTRLHEFYYYDVHTKQNLKKRETRTYYDTTMMMLLHSVVKATKHVPIALFLISYSKWDYR